MYVFHPIGTIINQKYQLIEVLGKGGWGVTYLAEDLHNKQKVALKALALNRLSDWKQVELFEREARVLQSLAHPAIPKYLEYFTVDTADNRCFYLAQELAAGKSLASWVKEGWRATESEVKQIAEQLLAILIYLHAQKPPVIHRDLKPDNIIRQADNKIFLVDFGAVKNTYYSTIARSSTVVGTYGYIAPEQFIGQAKPASDLYGLGATILFLLTHVPPAELSTDGLQIKFRDRINISSDFADWLETMVEPEIENRFEDAKTALTVLDGKQKNPLKINYSVSPKTLKITVGVVALAVLILTNTFKWGILSRLGIVPENICEPKVMTKYLKQGGDPNAWRNSFAESYPIVGCFSESETQQLIELFIEKGGKINSIANVIETPESSLILFRSVNKGNKFSDRQKQKITLKLLAKSQNITLLLLQNGADINVRDSKGNTFLHKTSDPDVVKIAIKQGVDVDVKNNNNETPLHKTKSSSVAQMLIDFGANIALKDDLGNSLLHLTKEPEIAAILIKNGIDPDTKNKQGVTALHNAWKNSSREILASVLIDGGANVNVQDNTGKTPLHTAVIGKTHPYYIEFLLEAGADIYIKDSEGKTPLDYARISQKQELIDLLTSYNSKQY